MQYTIQRWASQHVFLARVLLVISHTILGYIAYFTALNIADNLEIPWSLVFTPLLVSVLILLHYHKKAAPRGVAHLLVALRMLFWFFVGVQLSHFADEKIEPKTNNFSTFVVQKAVPETGIKTVEISKNKFLAGWKKLIQRDKKWIKTRLRDNADAFLIVLGAILLIILISIVALYLYCTLACSGAEGAAIIVLLLAVLSIIGVIVGASRMLNRTSKSSSDALEKEELRRRRQMQNMSEKEKEEFLQREQQKNRPKDANEQEKEELRKRRQEENSSNKQKEEVQKQQDTPKNANEQEKEELRKRRQQATIPKKDAAPTSTQKVEIPQIPQEPAPKPKKEKKLSPKERRYNKRLDKGIIWAKILTAIVLGGLIIFTILS